MTLDAPAILGEPIKFPNGMSAPNRFLKVSIPAGVVIESPSKTFSPSTVRYD
jgi:hypothetical protein